jgi:hypothetical protein
VSNYLHDLLVPLRSLAGRFKRRVIGNSSPRRYVSRLVRKSSVRPAKNGQAGTILFFSPEAGVTPHYAAQCVLARTLKERGHRVLFTRCFEIFERCPVMDLYQLPYTASKERTSEICLKCASASIEMLAEYGLESFDLRKLLTRDLLTKYDQALLNLPDDLREFEYDSIPFGRLCIHDLVLATKISNFEKVSKEIRVAWVKYVESSLLSYLLIDQLCEEFSISTIVHHNDYSLMLGARLAAFKHGIPSVTAAFAAHNAVDRRRYILAGDIIWATFHKQAQAWSTWREMSLSTAQVKAVADDLLIRLGAKSGHTYSPAKTFDDDDIRSRLGLAKDKKLLVAYTSSLDELLAGGMLKSAVGIPSKYPSQPFEDQIEWLQALIEFVGKRDDLQLVVRIHPREGANKRDSVKSMHLARLKEAFDRPLWNCLFVWPEDPVSSYDLGEAADLVLTSWSTIGLEMARLGVPVLTSTNGLFPFPHDDFLEWGQTADIYFNELERLLQRPPNLETIARAFRWYNLFHLGTSLNLGDLVPTHIFEGLPPFKAPREAAAIEGIITGGEDVITHNLQSLQGAQHPESLREEQAALTTQLRRIIHFFHTGEDSTEDFQLVLVHSDEELPDFSLDIDQGIAIPHTRILMVNGSFIRYVAEGKTYSRFSPMCARIASLCAHHIMAPSVIPS